MKTEMNKLSTNARGPYMLLALCLFVCATALNAHAQEGRNAPASERAVTRNAKAVAFYSCPMHPDVKAKKKARCPKCGMDLRPVYKEEADAHQEGTDSPVTAATTGESSTASGVSKAEDGSGLRTSAMSIPDVEMLDQDGRTIHFYTDLVKGKTVVINFIFTTCTTICPPLGATFARVQKDLGERAGRDVQLISVSVDPVTDTPERMKAWGAKFKAGAGWTFVTGQKPQVAELLRALGAASASPAEHTPALLIGNDLTGQWTRVYGLSRPAILVKLIDDAAAGRLNQSADSTGKESTR
jgi:protein SCO1/2